MSLVKASIIHELDFVQYFMKWLPGKQQSHYQIATKEYANKLRQILKYNLKRKERARLNALSSSLGLVVIRFGDHNEPNQPLQTKFNGVSIERSSFPGAKENDKVSLIPLKDEDTSQEDTSKRTILGTVISLDSSQIKIKFKSPIVLETIQLIDDKDSEAQKKEIEPTEEEKEEEKSNKELNKICEKHCHTDSEEDCDAEKKDSDDNEAKDNGGDSDSEDSTSKPPDSKLETNNEESEHTTKKNEDEEKQAVGVTVKPASYGIKMEPADDEEVMDYIHCCEYALKRFEKQSCSLPLHRFLLGFYSNYIDSITPKSRLIPLEGLPKPKYQQVLAIEQSLKRRISLIEGPPGSGKTLIAAQIACNASRVKDYKVLVCSPLQSTVDRLTELIDRVTCVEVVKLPEEHSLKMSGRLAIETAGSGKTLGPNARMRRTRALDENSDDLELMSYCRHLDKLVDDEIYLETFKKTKDNSPNYNHHQLHQQSMKQVRNCSLWRRRKIEKKLLDHANIVCCKTSQAGSHLLEELSFDMLIIDDAQLISEPDCFISLMTKGLKQVTLLSDMRRQIRLTRVQRNALKSTTSIASPQATKSPLPLAPNLEQDEIKADQQDNISSTPLLSNNSNTDGIANSKSSNNISFTATLAERRKVADRKREQTNNKRQSRTRRSSGSAGVSMASSNNITNIASPSSASSCGPSNELGGLFERWVSIGLPAVDLRHQYRMHETLSAFTNYHYYLNRSKNDESNNEKLTHKIRENFFVDDESTFIWLPKHNCLTAIFRTESILINEKLDQIVEKLLSQDNVASSQIGVIFNLHRESSSEEWQSKSIKHDGTIKCGTIEQFAGQEMDFIILVAGGQREGNQASQLVDLSLCSQIERNFMIEDCTLNLAITRARLGMFILTDCVINRPKLIQENGHPSTSKAEDSPTDIVLDSEQYCYSWKRLVEYYSVNELIV